MEMRQYEVFDIYEVAARGMNYITSMVDDKFDYLPYWFIQINENPAYARHVRVDDAELVASWYEAIVALEKIVGPSPRSQAVKEGFKKHLLRSWGNAGLRYHEPYPWSNTTHSSFHEMGWVLAGMNRLCFENPANMEAEDKAKNLVRGLRGLVKHRKIKTFWSGDFPMNERVYEFPSDLYFPEKGFIDERITGRGEECIRNAVLLEPLVTRAQYFGDETALDLAEGIANHLLGLSRYFNYKGEFFGHVHSAVWFAIGLIKLGKLLKNDYYIEKAAQIFEYVKSLSSEFGWVPEYAQWHPMEEEHCETCCIKDMIEFALEAVECGFNYWGLINSYTRNQLTEQQIKDGSFISADNTKEDENGYTWKNMDKRAVGGWSGGGEPNSLSLLRFRSIAGCCVGTAPVALWKVFDKTIEKKDDGLYINFPIARKSELATIEIGYPNAGLLRVIPHKTTNLYIRTYDWMSESFSLFVNGQAKPVIYKNGCVFMENQVPGSVVEIRHQLEERVTHEIIRGSQMHITWRGSDVVRIDPPGLPIMLYQREIGVPKIYPPRVAGNTAKPVAMVAPTDQKSRA
jgi:hypothetical protein